MFSPLAMLVSTFLIMYTILMCFSYYIFVVLHYSLKGWKLEISTFIHILFKSDYKEIHNVKKDSYFK